MFGLEGIIASVLIPAGLEILKDFIGGVSRRIGGLSVEDQLKLEKIQMEKVKALAELDNPYGTPSQWVVDLRASFRYIAAPLVIILGAGIIWAGVNGTNPDIIALGANLAGMPFGFIFGERMVLSFKGSGKK